jgi:PhnB protein
METPRWRPSRLTTQCGGQSASWARSNTAPRSDSAPDASGAIAWYKRALGARELWDLGGVAGLEIDAAPFFIHEVNPNKPDETGPFEAGHTSTRIQLFVDDPDELLARALSAGATLGSPIEKHVLPSGNHRQGGFQDPFGHRWSVGDKSPLRARTT